MVPFLHTMLLTMLLPWTPSGAGKRVLYRVSMLSLCSQYLLITKIVESLAQWESNGGTLIAEKLIPVIAAINVLISFPAASI